MTVNVIQSYDKAAKRKPRDRTSPAGGAPDEGPLTTPGRELVEGEEGGRAVNWQSFERRGGPITTPATQGQVSAAGRRLTWPSILESPLWRRWQQQVAAAKFTEQP